MKHVAIEARTDNKIHKRLL